MVLLDSHKVSRAPWYSGPVSNEPTFFRLQDYHLLWSGFPARSARTLVCHSLTPLYWCPIQASNPSCTTRTGLTYMRFGLFPFRSPLLRESLLLSVPAGTEMFHFPALASRRLWIQRRIGGIHRLGFPIRASPDHGLLAASRGLSQLATPFIAF